jgi:hypothetical protein
MNCYKHENINGINTCYKCGNWLCADCTVSIENRIICKDCISSSIDPSVSDTTKPKKDIPNSSLSFIISLLPGAGLMYLGLIKQGMLIGSTIFFLMWLNGPLLGLLSFILWISSIFYTLQCCKKLVSGKNIEDTIEPFISFAQKHKLVLAVILSTLFILNYINPIPLVLVIVIGYLIYSHIKNNKKNQ